MSQKQQNLRKRLAALFLTLSACAFAGPLWQASAAESSVSEAQQNQVTVTVLDETGAPVIQAGVMAETGGEPDERTPEYYEKRPCPNLVWQAARILDEMLAE